MLPRTPADQTYSVLHAHTVPSQLSLCVCWGSCSIRCLKEGEKCPGTPRKCRRKVWASVANGFVKGLDLLLALSCVQLSLFCFVRVNALPIRALPRMGLVARLCRQSGASRVGSTVACRQKAASLSVCLSFFALSCSFSAVHIVMADASTSYPTASTSASHAAAAPQTALRHAEGRTLGQPSTSRATEGQPQLIHDTALEALQRQQETNMLFATYTAAQTDYIVGAHTNWDVSTTRTDKACGEHVGVYFCTNSTN